MMKILIGVDESEFSQVAVREIAGGIWKPDTHVKIISVVERHYVPDRDGTAEADDYKTARASIDRAIETLRTSSNAFEVSGEILEGSPKQVILDKAESWGADLIAVGSHGRRGLERFLLGSVSQAVALHAHCSVLIARK